MHRTEDKLCGNCEAEICVCDQIEQTSIKSGAITKIRFLNKNFLPSEPKEIKIVPTRLVEYIIANFKKDIYCYSAKEVIIKVDELINIEYFLRDGGACTSELEEIRDLFEDLLDHLGDKTVWAVLIGE